MNFLKIKSSSMKFKALLFFFAFFCAAFVSAQSNASKVVPWVQNGDSLSENTTLAYELAIGGTFDKTKLWNYSVIVFADSISGANAGTVQLQISNDPAGTASPIWSNYGTAGTIDGTADQFFNYEGTLYARRLRVLITSPAGTRKTAIRLRGLFRQVE
jgi:hypothetical protein